MFRSYITYEEYKDLGGMVEEQDFDILERKAQRMLYSITFDRIKYLYVIPEEVKEVLTEYINKFVKNGKESVVTTSGNAGNVDDIVQYSNSVETITWRKPTVQEETREFSKLASSYLPDWLVYRGYNLDLREFLAMVPAEYLRPDPDTYFEIVRPEYGD